MKYHVNLSEAERATLKKHLQSKQRSMESKKHAQVLLDLDESNGKAMTARGTAARRGIHEITVVNIRKKYCQQGLSSVLFRKKRESGPIPLKVTGEVEAHIIATCCSVPPPGHCRWTLQMIANKVVLDGVVESISDEAVRAVLKKRNFSLTAK